MIDNLQRPIFICLTPARNEAWILETFIKYNSLWADYIIILDQMSTDQTKEVCDRYDHVIRIENNSLIFNEDERQIRLIEEARKIEAEKRIIIALDADEVLSSNVTLSQEWETIKQLPEGTVLKFPWFNVDENKKEGWFTESPVAFGFVDDGSAHLPQKIHSTRVPVPPHASFYCTKEIVNLHFQYIDPERNRKKQRWYMCWEHINFPDKHPIDIYRQYNKHYASSIVHQSIIKREWLYNFEEEGRAILNCKAPDRMWWDEEILDMFENYGTERFKKIDIWDCDWNRISEKDRAIIDPRSPLDKVILYWLKVTQKEHKKLYNRIFQKILKSLWK